MNIVLASKSPARKRLLEKMGLKFNVLETNTNERSFKAKSPAVLVKKITLGKAKSALNVIASERSERGNPARDRHGLRPRDDTIILITADSIVYLPKLRKKGQFLRHFPNGPIFGKAKNKSQAVRILKTLSNTTHRLYTGLCVAKINPGDNSLKNFVLTYDTASVRFKKLAEEEIKNYVNKESSVSFAGSYTIERHSNSSAFIRSYKGDINTIIGLPTKKLKKIFEDWKLDIGN